MNSNTFIFNLDWYAVLLEYPAEVRFEVYEAIMRYASSGTLPELKPLAKMAFSFIRKEIDFNRERYEATVEKRREAGRSSALARQSGKAQSMKANAAVAGQSRQKPADLTDADISQQTEQMSANSTSVGIVQQTEQNEQVSANATVVEQNKQKPANSTYNDNDNDNDNVDDNDKVFLERVRDDVPEIRNAYLGLFFSDEKQISLDRLLIKWETDREELRSVCLEVLFDWTHKQIRHPTAKKAKSGFFDAVRYKYSILKSLQNGKSEKASGKDIRPSRPGSRRLPSDDRPAYGLVD